MKIYITDKQEFGEIILNSSEKMGHLTQEFYNEFFKADSRVSFFKDNANVEYPMMESGDFKFYSAMNQKLNRTDKMLDDLKAIGDNLSIKDVEELEEDVAILEDGITNGVDSHDLEFYADETFKMVLDKTLKYCAPDKLNKMLINAESAMEVDRIANAAKKKGVKLDFDYYDNERHKTPLSSAIERNLPEVVGVLTDYGADTRKGFKIHEPSFGIWSAKSFNAFTYAAEFSKGTEGAAVVRKLFEKDPSYISEVGKFPEALLYSSYADFEVFKAFVDEFSKREHSVMMSHNGEPSKLTNRLACFENERDQTIFENVVLQKSPEWIKYCLNKAPELINSRGPEGRTPAHLLITWPYDDFEKKLQTLVNKGADLNAVDDYGNTVLTYAGVQGTHIEVTVPTILRIGNIDIDHRNNDGKSALDLVAEVNLPLGGPHRCLATKALLEAGAKGPQKALISALSSPLNLDNVKMILEANPNLIKEDGQGLLVQTAAQHSDFETVLYLMDNKAIYDPETILYAVAENNNYGAAEIAKYFVERDPDAEKHLTQSKVCVPGKDANTDYLSPVQLAAAMRHESTAMALLPTREVLTKQPVNNYAAASIFHIAAKNSLDRLTDHAIQLGGNPRVADVYMATPLHYLARQRNSLSNIEKDANRKIIQSLVAAGAGINAKDQNETPLIAAVRNGNTETAVSLIEEGASLISKDRFGRTATEYAFEMGNVRLLEAIANSRVPSGKILEPTVGKITARLKVDPEQDKIYAYSSKDGGKSFEMTVFPTSNFEFTSAAQKRMNRTDQEFTFAVDPSSRTVIDATPSGIIGMAKSVASKLFKQTPTQDNTQEPAQEGTYNTVLYARDKFISKLCEIKNGPKLNQREAINEAVENVPFDVCRKLLEKDSLELMETSAGRFVTAVAQTALGVRVASENTQSVADNGALTADNAAVQNQKQTKERDHKGLDIF